MKIEHSVMAFLKELSNNNTREWFTENKSYYQEQKMKMDLFFNHLYEELRKIDQVDKMQTFRIYRDVRFSKDKTPYKTNFGVAFHRKKPELRGGYYLQIKPNENFVGGGFWAPEPKDLLRIRQEIQLDDKPIKKVLNNKVFKDYFGQLTGDQVKTTPRGFSKDLPGIDLIKKKQYLVSKAFDESSLYLEDFSSNVLETFKAMRPFFDYMSEVLGTNINGESLFN